MFTFPSLIDACGKGNAKEVDAALILPIIRPLYGLKTPIVDDATKTELEILENVSPNGKI